MTAIWVGIDNGKHRAYSSTVGRDCRWIGPRFDGPREAIAYARMLRDVPQVQATRPLAEPDLAGVRTAPRSRDEVRPAIGSPEPRTSSANPGPRASLPGPGDPLSLGLL